MFQDKLRKLDIELLVENKQFLYELIIGSCIKAHGIG